MIRPTCNGPIVKRYFSKFRRFSSCCDHCS